MTHVPGILDAVTSRFLTRTLGDVCHRYLGVEQSTGISGVLLNTSCLCVALLTTKYIVSPLTGNWESEFLKQLIVALLILNLIFRVGAARVSQSVVA